MGALRRRGWGSGLLDLRKELARGLDSGSEGGGAGGQFLNPMETELWEVWSRHSPKAAAHFTLPPPQLSSFVL